MTERELMAEALALATLGEGTTGPNPVVGCVVVRDGAIAGAGFHRAPGEPHAEAVALAAAGERSRGATMYVTLEPCAHHGRTPPCVDSVIAAGIARVVVPHADPNPLVDGRGLTALRGAGIRVDVGLMDEEARRLNAPFFSWHRRGRPHVTLKAAVSCDGQIAVAAGSSTWVTGEPARRHAHRLRYAHDAVLVGATTVRRDDPRLTVRLPGAAAHRRRVVLAPHLDLEPRAKVFARDGVEAPRTRVYTGPSAGAGLRAAIEAVADVVAVGEGSSGLALDEVLSDLARIGVQSLLVEGGGVTHARFLEAGLADAVALFVAPRIFGARGATPLFALDAPEAPEDAFRLEEVRSVPLGRDTLLTGRPVR